MLVLAGDSVDDIVKDELKEKWFTDVKPKWFVLDETDAEQCREPGDLDFSSG